MKPVRSFAILVAVLSPVASAWPTWFSNLDSPFLVGRQDESTSAPPASETIKQETSRDPTKPVQTNLNTGKAPQPTTDKDGKTVTDTAKASPTVFDDRDPAGSVVMVTPAPIGGSVNLYKIGDHVTLGWTYTNLQANPTAINVLVSCSKASETWTVTANMTFQSDPTITWDTQAQATAVESPLLTEEYTLIVFDAASNITATPVPGFLGTYSGFKFGLYQPRPYVPLDEWHCATCASGSVGGLERSALGFAMTMSFIAVASFTWFVTGFGAI